jgi:hypothetical protein
MVGPPFQDGSCWWWWSPSLPFHAPAFFDHQAHGHDTCVSGFTTSTSFHHGRVVLEIVVLSQVSRVSSSNTGELQPRVRVQPMPRKRTTSTARDT